MFDCQRRRRDLDMNFISVICEVSFITFSQRISGKGQHAEVSTSASGQGGCGFNSGSDRVELTSVMVQLFVSMEMTISFPENSILWMASRMEPFFLF